MYMSSRIAEYLICEIIIDFKLEISLRSSITFFMMIE